MEVWVQVLREMNIAPLILAVRMGEVLQNCHTHLFLRYTLDPVVFHPRIGGFPLEKNWTVQAQRLQAVTYSEI